MNIVGDFLQLAAASLPIWRDAAMLVLALVVIGCMTFIAAVVEP